MTVYFFDPGYQDTVYSSRQDTVYNVLPQSSVSTGDSNKSEIVRIATPSPQPLKISPPSVKVVEQPVIPIQKEVSKDKWNSSDNFLINNSLTSVVGNLSKQKSPTSIYSGTIKPDRIVPSARNVMTHDWLLGIFIFLVVLFVWIRIFYNKFFATLAGALSSFQLSARLFEERNVLLHRVSYVLDFIYTIVFAVFLFEYIDYSGYSNAGLTGMNLFLLLLNITIFYTLFRIVMLRMTGSLFMVRSLFSEYIHNTFVVNKVLGIVLFPIVIMAHYMPYHFVPVIFILGIAIFVVAFLLKTFRAYQIIIRRDVLLFYLILYLCTLEFLPLLLGFKFVTSLIQSN